MTATDPSEVRRQAEIGVRIASAHREDGDRVLGYYVRSALAHGLTYDEVCRAGGLYRDEVFALSDPEVC